MGSGPKLVVRIVEVIWGTFLTMVQNQLDKDIALIHVLWNLFLKLMKLMAQSKQKILKKYITQQHWEVVGRMEYADFRPKKIESRSEQQSWNLLVPILVLVTASLSNRDRFFDLNF